MDEEDDPDPVDEEDDPDPVDEEDDPDPVDEEDDPDPVDEEDDPDPVDEEDDGPFEDESDDTGDDEEDTADDNPDDEDDPTAIVSDGEDGSEFVGERYAGEGRGIDRLLGMNDGGFVLAGQQHSGDGTAIVGDATPDTSDVAEEILSAVGGSLAETPATDHAESSGDAIASTDATASSIFIG